MPKDVGGGGGGVGSSERVPGPAKDAGVHGELVNESSGKGIHTGCLGVLDTGPSS